MILRTFISALLTLDIKFFVIVHVSDPYSRTGLSMVLYMVVLQWIGMFLSFNSG